MATKDGILQRPQGAATCRGRPKCRGTHGEQSEKDCFPALLAGLPGEPCICSISVNKPLDSCKSGARVTNQKITRAQVAQVRVFKIQLACDERVRLSALRAFRIGLLLA